ncbi:MAG: pentapeptide repeat-containing protein [Nostoc sp.]|uniref:pentapeptide repeat-containing protein n=1 Tax=Nostoc sp. TaxID=1180 RepID=UPI002FEF112F
MNRDELIRRYAAGERNFALVKFSDPGLDGINLSGTDLTGNNMEEFYLARAILKAVSLVNAKLFGSIHFWQKHSNSK